jgi:translation initiation factor 1
MTIITGVPLRGQDLKDLVKQLKQKCGTGGTVKGEVIEIQGDHRVKLVAELSARGWTVKKAGG